jgi:hypothetical protein
MTKEQVNEMKATMKFDWYMDSSEDQKTEGRFAFTKCHCFTHTGHPKRVYPIADVDANMRLRIAALARNNVSVASIQTSILDEFKVMLSDYQV